MSTPVLLVCAETLWYGAARIPHALADAGFEVALLAPHGSLAEKSRYVRKVGHLPADATAAQWVFAFAAMVRAMQPRLVIPGDDMSFRLLQWLHDTPPTGLQPAMHEALAALIRTSLGDPAHYLVTVDKTRLPVAAAAAGVPVAPFAVVDSPNEARAFIAEHGFPLVAKRSFSTAGSGVAICATEAELFQAFADFERARAGAGPDVPGRSVLVQKAIEGKKIFYPVVAWQGRLLAGWASEKLVANPEPKGPATVIRRFRDDPARAVSEALVGRFGMSGLLNLELMIDDETGARMLIEINRRVAPGIHGGARIGIDLCAALHAALEGRAHAGRTDLDPGETSINVHFPQEWLRDPQSTWLRTHPVDVPWDEPELFEALLAMRHVR